jgi:hypothetical protein
MVAELTERQQRVDENLVAMGQHRVRVHSSSGAFQIHFENSTSAQQYGMAEMVRPRVPMPDREAIEHMSVNSDSVFSFELPANDQTFRVIKRLPRGEFRFEVVDTLIEGTKMRLLFKVPSQKREFESKLREMKEREQNLIDLDSLLRESEKEPAVTPQKKNGKELELEIMM